MCRQVLLRYIQVASLTSASFVCMLECDQQYFLNSKLCIRCSDNGSRVGQPNLECYNIYQDFPPIVLLVPSRHNISSGTWSSLVPRLSPEDEWGVHQTAGGVDPLILNAHFTQASPPIQHSLSLSFR